MAGVLAGRIPAIRDQTRSATKLSAQGHVLRAAAALSIGFLIVCPYLMSFAEPSNRCMVHWTWRHPVAALLCIVCIALGGLVAHYVARQNRREGVRAAWTALLAAGAGIILAANLHAQVSAALGWKTAGLFRLTCLVWLLVVAGLVLAGRHWRLRVATLRGCLAAVPLAVVVLLQVFTYPRYPETPSRLAAFQQVGLPAAGSPQPSVYVLLFDGWSYTRAFENGQVPETFPNLAEFSAGATVYHDAHSPGTSTWKSMPRLLFEPDDKLHTDQRGPHFLNERRERIEPASRPNLFGRAGELGLTTWMVGVYMPYRQLLGRQVDHCASWSVNTPAPGDDLGGHLTTYAWGIAARWLEPVGRSPVPLMQSLSQSVERAQRHMKARGNSQILTDLDRLTRQVLSRPEATFAVFHYPLPHPPFIYDARGFDPARIDVPDQGTSEQLLDGYYGSLAHVDTLVGRVVEALRLAGKYDDSIIVLTADHSWNNDPALVGPGYDLRLDVPTRTHVPLIVRSSGRSQRRDVHRRVCTAPLLDLLLEEHSLESVVARPRFDRHVATAKTK